MWCIFAAGILNFSVCVFSLEISRGCTYIGGGRGRLEKKMGGIEFQTGGADRTPDWQTSYVRRGFFPPTTAIVSLQQGISCVHLMYFPRFARVFSRLAVVCLPNFPGLQLRISLSLVITLFAASILEPLKRLCCLVSPFKSPNPAGLYQV